MYVQAISDIRSIKGKTCSRLMLGDDGDIYVVKLPQGANSYRRFASEYLAATIAKTVGLPVADCLPIQVPRAWAPETAVRENHASCKTILCSGSRLVRGPDGRSAIDILPSGYLHQLNNVDSFWGMLAFDKWCSNIGSRNAVFCRTTGAVNYAAYFIGHGDSFSGATWSFSDTPGIGLYHNKVVYDGITSWDSFEPCISALVSINPQTIWNLVNEVPAEWYGGKTKCVEELVESLLRRRSKIHELLDRGREANPECFPAWTRKVCVTVPSSRNIPVSLFALGEASS